MHLRQRGRVVSVSDSQSSGPGFESHSDHYLDLFLGSPEVKFPATLVNSQLKKLVNGRVSLPSPPLNSLVNQGRERHSESRAFSPGAQHNFPSQGSNPDRFMRSSAFLTYIRPLSSHIKANRLCWERYVQTFYM